jgi:hypothetical protein
MFAAFFMLHLILCTRAGIGPGFEPPTRGAPVRISIGFNCLIDLNLIRSVIAPKASNDPIIFHTSNYQRAQVLDLNGQGWTGTLDSTVSTH